MGRFSLAVFGRRKLPRRCIIYGGAYVPSRRERVRPLFDKWRFVRGNWVPYAFAEYQRKEFLVLFNVYGASMTLEILHLLKDGGVTRVFFIGSMFAKNIPVGMLVLPTEVIDRAGIVLIDDPRRATIMPNKSSLDPIRSALKRTGLLFEEAKVVSVPCVMHEIGHVKHFIENNDDIAGVEMEVSTFFHFGKKLGLRCYALLYVSDSQRYNVISTARLVQEARRKALRNITRLPLELL